MKKIGELFNLDKPSDPTPGEMKGESYAISDKRINSQTRNRPKSRLSLINSKKSKTTFWFSTTRTSNQPNFASRSLEKIELLKLEKKTQKQLSGKFIQVHKGGGLIKIK